MNPNAVLLPSELQRSVVEKTVNNCKVEIPFNCLQAAYSVLPNANFLTPGKTQ